MTGIERLRDIAYDGPYSGGMIHISVQKLREICEQIEREVGDISGYESDVLAFVEEKGGLDALKKRLMPEGMEWPTVDGKPVDFVTGYEPSLGVLEAVSIYSNGACEVMGHDGIIKDATEIHIAAPKVLDADGVEIRVGDTVYYVDGREQKVNTVARLTDGLVQFGRINEAGYVTYCEGACISPDQLTHRAPVLAADGRPLREGETVWYVESGTEYEVVGIHTDEDSPVRVMRTDGTHLAKATKPSQLTHAKPEIDTWQRIEEDAGCTATKYNERRGTIFTTKQQVARDLVRRARALAERDAS